MDAHRLGIDTGGTFTDFVHRAPDGSLRTHKVLSTPDDPVRAVLEGLRALLPRGVRAQVCYGSTVATNDLLERKGARTAFVTNAGFEDLLVLARQTRARLYDLRLEPEPPLVSRDLCLGVGGRLGPAGEELEVLDAASLPQLVEALRCNGAQSVAVCLLHSYANPAHERAVGAALRAALELPVTLSSELLPEHREFERAMTTVVNAYVAPLMTGHLRRLGAAVTERQGEGATLRVMQRNGGVMDAEDAAREPVRTALSGPAGGVVGAVACAASLGESAVLSLDMGGTSTDVALCLGGVETTTEGAVAGLPLRVPLVDLHTVGAGGGSIARVDAGGLLRVGPQSAGADPGPACYGRGGPATVSDANLVLGRLLPAQFLGGRMPLDAAAARAAIAPIAEALERSVEEAARGILRVANATVERALRLVSVDRGHRPGNLCLVAFGGAGGLHACALADALGIRRVLIPESTGVLSARGIVAADRVRDRARAMLGRLSGFDAERLDGAFGELEAAARADFPGEEPELHRSLDLRFEGQSFELRVPWQPDLEGAFVQAYTARYGSPLTGRPVELVTLRVRARVRTEALATEQQPDAGVLDPGPAQPLPLRDPDAPQAGGEIPVYERAELAAGERLRGPALVLEDHATTLVAQGWVASALHGALSLAPEARP
jgi:N-methylhydantoinase A